MWRFNPFSGKDQQNPNCLENRTLEVGPTKVTIKTIIAEGGFSSVYSCKDFNSPSKNYALKRIICNDSETLDLVLKEIQVMKTLKGNPNVVTLISSAVFDAGRFKEAVLVMEFCEKSLVGVLMDNKYLEEKEIFLIFRDVCNAVFGMHSQSPPIAHRDLKAENVLLGSDGKWKLCDFGSTSTNHKCFHKPDEMGIEEDIIRKHTTPAYRAPEMWDLYRKEVISGKVDIWALGCLLYRICYLKSAFDGESKLQILNGNYKIPEQPKYSNEIIGLIKDLLQNSPNNRPDIMQVWFRVNSQLPIDLQKSHPDGCHSDGPKRSPPIPKWTPPPPTPSKDQNTPVGGGAFWSTSQNSPKTKQPVYDKEPLAILKPSPSTNSILQPKLSPPLVRKSASSENTHSFVTNFESAPQFVANFENTPQFVANSENKSSDLERELANLKEELRKTNLEKSEILAKYEKLSAICKSQRNELQELRRAKIPVPVQQSSQKKEEEIKGTVWELEQGMISKNKPKDNNNNNWYTFIEPKFDQTLTQSNDIWGFRTNNGTVTGMRKEEQTPPGWAGF